MSKKLYVGNLNFRSTEDDIRTLFSSYGEVSSVSLINDPNTGRSRGFGFVEMTTEEAAAKAKEGLNGSSFQERNLNVDLARPKSEGSGGGFGGGRDRERSSGGSGNRSFRRY